MADIKRGVIVGRIILIDTDNSPDLTAEEFLSYINEGCVPFASTVTDGIGAYQMLGYMQAPVSQALPLGGITLCGYASDGRMVPLDIVFPYTRDSSAGPIK